MQIRALPNGACYNPPPLVAIRRNDWTPSIRKSVVAISRCGQFGPSPTAWLFSRFLVTSPQTRPESPTDSLPGTDRASRQRYLRN
jgi:hypothetical protein